MNHKKQIKPIWPTPMAIAIIICACFLLGTSSCNTAKKYNRDTIVEQDNHLLKLSNGLVIDTELNLMWPDSDNGTKVSFDEAQVYVKNFNYAGYTDWRFPTIQELEALMVYDPPNTTEPAEGCAGNYLIHRFFKLTCCCPWALQDNGTRPAAYPFMKSIASGSMWHHKSGKLGNRVIPVRDLK